jgi:colicin import membrane protein
MKRVIGIILVLGACACQSKQDQQKMLADAYAQGEAKAKAEAQAAAKAAQEAREKEAREKAERLAKERANFVSNPSEFLSATVEAKATGFLWTDTTLRSITVFNKSRFPAANIQGMADWLDRNGGLISSTPFSVTGSVGPGQSATFSSETGTLRSNKSPGHPAQVNLKITRVTTIDLPPTQGVTER